ncbi:hypothetical protein KM043_008802 [Ampulex compressa]|nr:hypothetical protein KM043_008802 [Ampulex compressa]
MSAELKGASSSCFGPPGENLPPMTYARLPDWRRREWKEPESRSADSSGSDVQCARFGLQVEKVVAGRTREPIQPARFFRFTPFSTSIAKLKAVEFSIGRAYRSRSVKSSLRPRVLGRTTVAIDAED